MADHAALSRSAISNVKELKQANVITGLLDGLETSIAGTLAEQKRSGEFLRQYGLAGKRP